MTTPSAMDCDSYILASVAQHFLDAMRERGIETAVLSKALGVDLEALVADPESWVPIRVFEDLVCKTLAFHPDPLLGLHVGHLSDGALFGIVGYLTQACTTLQDIFTAIPRYERLVCDVVFTSLRHEPGIALACCEFKGMGPVFTRHAVEFMLANYSRHVRAIKDKSTPALLAVHFRHSAPESLEVRRKYEEYFGCPVKFDQPQSALLIPASLMNHRLRPANPSLQILLERHAQLLLSERTTAPSLVDQIRRKLQSLLMRGMVSREQLADELGISARQLHRQLQKAGSSYSELVDEIRTELAKSLLQQSANTVEVIGLRLGFTEASTFIRWFRQKVGRTPGDFRQVAAMAPDADATPPDAEEA